MTSKITFELDHRGDHIATWMGHYHASGFTRDLAVRRLAAFVQESYPSVWHSMGLKEAVVDYFRPINSTSEEQADD